MTIGERIKSLREEKGITQTELANAIGTTKQNIYKYENGIITNIPSDKIELIASFFGVSPGSIMGWEDDKWYLVDGKLRIGYWHKRDLDNKIIKDKLIAATSAQTQYIPVFNIDDVYFASLDPDFCKPINYLPTITTFKSANAHIYVICNTKYNDYKDNMYPLIEEKDMVLLDFGAEPQNGDLTMIEFVPGKNFFCRYYKYDDFIEFQFISNKPLRIRKDDENYTRYDIRGVVRQVIKNIQ